MSAAQPMLSEKADPFSLKPRQSRGLTERGCDQISFGDYEEFVAADIAEE
jgi:hypothetical protein